MAQKIDTYQDFLSEIVEPDFHDFFADKSNLRRAWQCAGSLFHLHDWVYEAHKTSIDAKYTFTTRRGATQSVSKNEHFANALGQLYPNFQLVRGIANASKHFALKTITIAVVVLSILVIAANRPLAAWVMAESKTSDTNRITRLVSSKEWARYQLKETFSECLQKR